jgi:pyruvate dehydrogenase E2 component (dihydrolipoamide acetyltransferase)
MRVQFKLPDIGEGVVEGEIVRWLVGDDEEVMEDQPIVEVMTDKATVEIPSPVKGRVVKRHGPEGSSVPVGAVLVEIETEDGAGRQVAKAAPAEAGPSRRRSASDMEVLATPAVRKLARERGIEIKHVKGSGPGGRVTMEDLAQYTEGAEPPAASETRPSPSPEDREEVMAYRGVRRKSGERLALSKSTAPHYTYVDEVDVTDLGRLRALYGELSGTRLTYLPFVIKAVIEGLVQYPLLNASLDEEHEQIRVKRYYNIGIATATSDGLIVPVVKQADRKSIPELAREIARLSEAAREGRIKVEDLKDGTFTITSLGPLGGLLATPIINYPEVAILGLHKIGPKPVVRDNQIVIREMMNLSISLDHRVVDGVVAANFVARVRQYLENPGLFALAT